MSNPRAVYERFQAASQAWGDVCATAPERWHRPAVAESSELYSLLLPHAEGGEMYCQYAVATIIWLKLRCETKEDYEQVIVLH